MLIGQNGILERAGDAVEFNKIGQDTEAIKLSYTNKQIEKIQKFQNGNITAEELQNQLVADGYTEATVTEEEGTLTVTMPSKNQYIVTQENGYLAGVEKKVSVGGPQLITFWVDEDEYQCEEGMTWGEFVDSEYNDRPFYLNGGRVEWNWDCVGLDRSTRVGVADVIGSGARYCLIIGGDNDT